MRILFEDTMPFAGVYFSGLGDTHSYSWQTLTPDDLIDVDILAIRSTTKVNEALLSKANKLNAVATATAGTNHMDIAMLQQRNINWFAAGGCNAIAVAQYVVSAIMYAHEQGELDYRDITVGIVGAGNVGTALSQFLQALNISYVLCDPPIEQTDPRSFVPLQDALKCEVISLHVPFTQEGEHATDKLLGESQLNQLATTQWLINACRGEVVDESVLLALKQNGQGPQLVLDVWQNEPNIDVRLMSYARIATPHIAGHTDEGKIRGTQMVYDFLVEQCGIKSSQESPKISDFLPVLAPLSMDGQTSMYRFLQSIYDIHFDHRIFVEKMAESNTFSALRKNYRGRREYDAYSLLNSSSLSQSERQILNSLGFQILS